MEEMTNSLFRRHMGWLVIGLAACAPASSLSGTNNNDSVFVNSFDQLARVPVGSRISFRGYFQEGHEVSGVYMSYRDYSRINTRCLSVVNPPSYRRYLDGRDYLVRGTLIENPCSGGGNICRNACDTYKLSIDSVTHP